MSYQSYLSHRAVVAVLLPPLLLWNAKYKGIPPQHNPINMSHNIESNSTNVDASFSILEKEIRINSVSEFIEKIGQLNKVEVKEDTETFYYRGHADRTWSLLPSILRTSNGESNGVEKEHLLFRDMVAHIPQSFSECKSALDYLVQMQHYELPTRLLDVTTNPLVALYFACESAGDVIAGIEAGVKEGGYIFEASKSEYVRLRTINPRDQDSLVTSAYMIGALAAASDASPTDVEKITQVLVSDNFNQNPEARDLAYSLATPIAMAASKAGAVARLKDGAVYLFSIPKGKVKHYDSDTVSVLANLAKCSDQEIDIYTEQIKDERKCKVLEKFNKRDGIQILLRQIKEEKPYFEPLIRPNDLSSIFLVKAKYGNPRIINQAGAFFIFGLGLTPSTKGCGGRLTKKVDVEIPSDWIKYKFIVPKDKKKKILMELEQLGITESYLFPEMDKYAKVLKKRYKL